MKRFRRRKLHIRRHIFTALFEIYVMLTTDPTTHGITVAESTFYNMSEIYLGNCFFNCWKRGLWFELSQKISYDILVPFYKREVRDILYVMSFHYPTVMGNFHVFRSISFYLTSILWGRWGWHGAMGRCLRRRRLLLGFYHHKWCRRSWEVFIQLCVPSWKATIHWFDFYSGHYEWAVRSEIGKSLWLNLTRYRGKS